MWVVWRDEIVKDCLEMTIYLKQRAEKNQMNAWTGERKKNAEKWTLQHDPRGDEGGRGWTGWGRDLARSCPWRRLLFGAGWRNDGRKTWNKGMVDG